VENFGFVKETLENYENLSPEKAERFKTLMFGWRIKSGKYKPNLFETILMQPEAGELIGLVWDAFKIWQKGFVLNLVRKLIEIIVQYK
jgi:hypothetical protein